MVILVRHGETDLNYQSRFQGRINGRLSPSGVETVIALGRKLRSRFGRSSIRLFCSPLVRALQTAQLLSPFLGLSIHELEVRDELTEVDFGLWDGLTKSEARAKFQRRYPGKQYSDYLGLYQRYPGGECLFDAFKRLQSIRSSLIDASRVNVVIAHGGAGRMLRAVMLQRDPNEFVFSAQQHNQIIEIDPILKTELLSAVDEESHVAILPSYKNEAQKVA
jgi:broad specificity phosphatase PhoE